MALDDSRDDFSAAKRRLATSIRADLLAGRGTVANLRHDAQQSLYTAISGAIAPAADAELPVHDLHRGKARATPIAAIIGPLVPFQDAPRPRGELSPATTIAERIERLEGLELELYQLLASSAPALWEEIRRPLTRLLRRSRRALRAIQRERTPEGARDDS